jgi:hypothetical protein
MSQNEENKEIVETKRTAMQTWMEEYEATQAKQAGIFKSTR